MYAEERASAADLQNRIKIGGSFREGGAGNAKEGSQDPVMKQMWVARHSHLSCNSQLLFQAPFAASPCQCLGEKLVQLYLGSLLLFGLLFGVLLQFVSSLFRCVVCSQFCFALPIV